MTVIGEVMVQALVRKRSEAALRASEARWRSIFETSTLAISDSIKICATQQQIRRSKPSSAIPPMNSGASRRVHLTVGEERGPPASGWLRFEKEKSITRPMRSNTVIRTAR